MYKIINIKDICNKLLYEKKNIYNKLLQKIYNIRAYI